ncbi:hypothetical protein DIPPA_20081 [Diplonema papillatum]|nr:hypothetical protein DIPPA_20081 [Diplonema papillatum]
MPLQKRVRFQASRPVSPGTALNCLLLSIAVGKGTIVARAVGSTAWKRKAVLISPAAASLRQNKRSAPTRCWYFAKPGLESEDEEATINLGSSTEDNTAIAQAP